MWPRNEDTRKEKVASVHRGICLKNVCPWEADKQLHKLCARQAFVEDSENNLVLQMICC